MSHVKNSNTKQHILNK